MNYNTIKIKKYSDVIEEFVAAEGATILPGMVVKLTTDGEVEPGGSNLPMIALEDELQGKGINDAYAAGDPVQVWIPYRGDMFYGILADGEAVEIGAFVEAGADGYLVAHNIGVVVGQAVEAVDLSGSDNVGNKRIVVRVI